MARYIQGSCGVANIDNTDSIRAEDVFYDNSAGLFPPGTDNVQDALEEAGGGATVAEMTPTVAGTAYGEQDQAKELNSLGEGVNIDAATARSTARYNAGIPGTPQAASYADCIFDDNRCTQDASTTLANSIASINETGIGSSAMSASTVIANTSTLTGTPVENSILHLNTTGAGGGSSCLDSAVITNSSSLNSAVLNRSVMLTSRMNGAGLDFTRSTIIGDATNATFGSVAGSAFFASSGAQVVNLNGTEALYLGNQTRAETVASRDAMISSYDRFFLRTLRADASTGNVAFYEPGSGELTYGPPPAPILASAGTISSAWFPAVYNPTTNVLAYTSSNRISRVYRGQGTTDANGSVTFNPGGLIVVNTAGNAITATVVSASTAIAYTCQINNIISGTYSIQVFQSTSAALGSATMVRAGSGLVVHTTLAY